MDARGERNGHQPPNESGPSGDASGLHGDALTETGPEGVDLYRELGLPPRDHDDAQADDDLAPEDPETSAFPPGSLGGAHADEDLDPDGPRANPFHTYDESGTAEHIIRRGVPTGPSHAAPGDGPAPPYDWDEPEEDAARAGTDRLSAQSLTADTVLRQRRATPRRGWRRAVLNATGGVVNLGPSATDLRRQEAEDRVRTPIQGCHKLAVISLKGGVGKTTTAAALGSMFASLRGDRVIAVDANPDRGTLGEKIVGEVQATVREFVGNSPRLERYSDVRRYTAQAPSRLEVLASESDPLASMAFSESDYRVVTDVLERFYNLILTDCGTGLLHSAMVGVLATVEQVVIVSSASLDGAKSAAATLDWLEAHQYEELARDSVTVISSVRPRGQSVDLEQIEHHFASRTRAVVSIPYDDHLAAGGQMDLDQLRPVTYEGYVDLAAEVAEAFDRIPGYNP